MRRGRWGILRPREKGIHPRSYPWAFAAGVLIVGGVQACLEPGANCFGGTPITSYTGGPNYDWDIFTNGQYRCRNILNGHFSANYNCVGMPVDDDRWPN